MRWLWSLPLIPFLMCGVICFGGVAVAFVAGRWSATGEGPTGGETPVRKDVSTHG